MERRRFLAAAAAAGIAAVAGCADPLSTADTANGTEGASDLGLSVVRSTGSLADSNAVHSGWVHLAAHGSGYDMTFDVRICHGRETGVGVALSETGNGRYKVAFSTTSTTGDSEASTAKANRAGCELGTRIRASTVLPRDLDTLTFVADGDQVLAFEKEGGVGEMRPLPDPLSWS